MCAVMVAVVFANNTPDAPLYPGDVKMFNDCLILFNIDLPSQLLRGKLLNVNSTRATSQHLKIFEDMSRAFNSDFRKNCDNSYLQDPPCP